MVGHLLQLLHHRRQLVQVVHVVLERGDVLVLRLFVDRVVDLSLESVGRRPPLLLVLDQPRFAAALEKADAAVSSARATLALARRESTRDNALGNLVASETRERHAAKVDTELAALAQAFRMPVLDGLLFAFALAQGGEFASALFAFATLNDVLTQALCGPLSVAVALSTPGSQLLLLPY